MQTRTWRWIRLLGLLVAFAILIYMFRNTDPRNIWAVIVGMEPWYLIPVCLGAIGMPVFRALRLRYIMSPQHHVPMRRVVAVYNVGQLLNIILPVLTGQVARVLLFSRTLELTKTFAFTMVMLEVLFDGVVVVVMMFGVSFLVVLPDWMMRGEVAVLIACILLLGFFYWTLHRHQRPPGPPGWLRRHSPERLAREWDNIKMSFLGGLNMLRSTRHLVMVVTLSLLSWLSHALLVLFLLDAFNLTVPFWGAMVILIVNTLVIMVPVSPGNLGTFQLACVVGLAFFGVSKDGALGFSIFLHLAEIGPVFVFGTIASFSQHVRLRDYRPAPMQAEGEELVAAATPSVLADCASRPPGAISRPSPGADPR